MTDGELLLSTANNAFRRRRSEKLGRSVYAGFEWTAAVAQAMRDIPKKGKRKDRRDVAEEVTARIFDKARGSTPTRLQAVAVCVPQDGAPAPDAGNSELEAIATEVHRELSREDAHNFAIGKEDKEDLVSGMVDIAGLIQLIMGIIQAIRQCRQQPVPNPNPQPTPVNTPHHPV